MLEFLLVYVQVALPLFLILIMLQSINLFLNIPLECRWRKVFKWLIPSVLKAKQLIGSNKESYIIYLVYTWFKEDFPLQSKFMRYRTFCKLVLKALKQNENTP